MTGNFIQLPFADMAKRARKGPAGTPGRKPDSVPPASSAFRLEFAARLRAAREDAKLSYVEIAGRLTKAVGYEITADNYRKYETGAKPSRMPLELIFHFSEITGRTPGTLLAPLPFRQPTLEVTKPAHPRHSRTGTY